MVQTFQACNIQLSLKGNNSDSQQWMLGSLCCRFKYCLILMQSCFYFHTEPSLFPALLILCLLECTAVRNTQHYDAHKPYSKELMMTWYCQQQFEHPFSLDADQSRGPSPQTYSNRKSLLAPVTMPVYVLKEIPRKSKLYFRKVYTNGKSGTL